MTVCLFIIGIIGTWCEQDAHTIGVCHPVGNDSIYCTVDADDMLIRASWYDPTLGGINCFDNTCDHLGDGTPTADGYGRYAACPVGMYGEWIDIDNVGLWQCRDHGGDVVPKFGEVYTASGFVSTWYITVDFLLESPQWWTYGLFDFDMLQ